MSEIFRAIVPLVPVRKTNSDTAEMVTQLLFGEQCEKLDQKGQWVHIENVHDGYIGWVDEKQISLCQKSHVLLDTFVTSLCLHAKSCISGENLLLSAGAEIKTYIKRKDAFFFNGVEFQILAGNYRVISESLKLAEVLRLAQEFVNVPYLWGGRSSMGIDCSGLTQVLFKLMGIKLPRDASQQVHEGSPISAVNDWQPGDLAFFGKDPDKITHVGILLDQKTIIHASGKVRVDLFNKAGIYDEKAAKNTHQLQCVKRLL